MQNARQKSGLMFCLESSKDSVGAATTSSSGGKNKRGDLAVASSDELKPDRILAAMQREGELMFLMKWTGKDEADLVSAKQANAIYPQVVINFYEKHLVFGDVLNNQQ